MATSSFRAYSALVSVFVVIAGFILGGGAIALRVASHGASHTMPIFWVWVGGGVCFVLFGLFSLGLALGRNDKPVCPHCGGVVDVRVGSMTGQLQLDKPHPD